MNNIEIKTNTIYIFSKVNTIAYNRSFDKYVIDNDKIITTPVKVSINGELIDIIITINNTVNFEINKSWNDKYFITPGAIRTAVNNALRNISVKDIENLNKIEIYI